MTASREASAALQGHAADGHNPIRQLIWIYFGLLIFEGAVRKWILPQLSDPLLIIRDPVVIAIYVVAIARGCYPNLSILGVLYLIAGLSLLVSAAFGVAPFIVNLYGVRTNVLHLPLMFLMGQVLQERDVTQFGRWFLLLAPPMAVLMALQFLAPPDSFLNKATFGEGGQIGAALGRIRPAGLFSYNTGAGQFFALTTAFLLVGWTRGTYPLWLRVSATGSLVLALAVSGSRTTVLACGIVLATFMMFLLSRPKDVPKGFIVLLAIGIIGLAVGSTGLFKEGFLTLTTRFEDAHAGGGSMLVRVWNGFSEPFQNATLIGKGLGLGTNVGSKLTTGGTVFLLSEGEWGRVIDESGIVLGLGFLIWRVFVAGYIGLRAFASMRTGAPMPILLFGATAWLMISGQFGQATSLGFASFGAGLCLAACRRDEASIPMPTIAPIPVRPLQRGRSIYAEHLHGS